MSIFKQFLDRTVDVEISGEKKLTGVLIDIGQDILVVYNGYHFLYVPLHHVKHIKANSKADEEIQNPGSVPMVEGTEISYRIMLQHARGQFTEIYVSGNQAIHGYVTSTLNDYFVFYSPVFKSMYIPLFHLKWLIPYQIQQTPYSLDRSALPVSPSSTPLSRTFEEQIGRLQGKLVVFDLGMDANKIGLLQNVNNHFAELVTAQQNRYFWNIQHIKTVHSPML